MTFHPIGQMEGQPKCNFANCIFNVSYNVGLLSLSFATEPAACTWGYIPVFVHAVTVVLDVTSTAPGPVSNLTRLQSVELTVNPTQFASTEHLRRIYDVCHILSNVDIGQ